jgi:hypothetical protein
MGKGFSASAIAAGNEFGRVFALRIMQAMSIMWTACCALKQSAFVQSISVAHLKISALEKHANAENLSTNAVDKYVQSL